MVINAVKIVVIFKDIYEPNIKQFITILISTVLFIQLTSCNAENNNISLDELPLIDVHAHTFKQNPLVLINLARRENLEKIYIISRSYKKHLPIIRANRDIARMLIMPETKSKGWWKKSESFILKNRDVVAGIKLHPSVDNYIASLQTLSDVFASAEKNRFVIVTHTDYSKKSNAQNFKPLLEKHPKTKLILYHSCPLDSAIELIKDYPNVFVDISYTSYNKEWQRRILNEVGANKVLFGIDTPIGWPKDNDGNIKKHYRNVVNRISPWYGSDREIMEKILYKNARNLFEE